MSDKLKSIRAGHRSVVSRLMNKFDEIEHTASENCDELSNILDNLTRKRDLLRGMDEEIVQSLGSEEIEAEIVDSEEYMYNLDAKICKVSKLLSTHSSTLNPRAESFSSTTNQPSQPVLTQESNEFQEHTSQSFQPDFRSASNTSSTHSKLPKLQLPTFNGDILQWQSFWDSYESAVHYNQSLSDAQRFNYLKSLLHDEALQTVSGFALTNSNYDRAVALLQKRYGQSHKIKQRYMQALFDIPPPRNTHKSLRNYYDSFETYVRGLESLGLNEEALGSLLVPVILNKLPGQMRTNLAREHGSTDWNLDDLREGIFHEINMLEAGDDLNTPFEEPVATAAFVTHAKSRSKQCKKRHHTSLCKNRQEKEQQNSVSVNTIQEAENEVQTLVADCEVLHSQVSSGVLLKTAIAPVSSEYNIAESNILFDEGAQRSFVTEKLASKLNLPVTGTEVIALSGFGDTTKSKKVRRLNTGTVYLITNTGTKLPIKVLVVPDIAAPLKIFVRETQNLKYLSGIKLAHPMTQSDYFEILLLIGADSYWSIVQDKVVRGDGPTAVQSKIGYLLSGPASVSQTSTNVSMLNVMATSKIESIDLEKFWKVESSGVELETENLEETKFQDLYKESGIRYCGNRYYAKLPWKDDHPTLPDNEVIAKRRTENVIKRLTRQPDLLKAYGSIIADQEKREFIEKVPAEDDEIKGNKIHYIPHHYVKKESATTPIRIVFDCSCKSSNGGPSLNDCLMNIAPDLNELSAILLRFRTHDFAVSTDIEKAFLNVGLEQEDRDATRFYWLENPNDPSSQLIKYRFKSVLFGATCSPFILNAVIKKHLKENTNEYTTRLQQDLYVDNILSSFRSEKELLDFYESSISLFTKAGFNLRSWATNSTELNNKAKYDKVTDNDELIKILGMRWNTSKDRITFTQRDYEQQNSEVTMTKREVLRRSSQIYDPLGLLSPITVRSKMLMQSIWESKVDWDDPLSAKTIKEWTEIENDISESVKLEFRRNYLSRTTNEENDLQLHIFTDASVKAYGTCAYLTRGQESTLIMSKTKVAPLKKLTIQKLELMAAVLGARLLKHVISSIEVKRAFLWSDSQIVLSWIKSEKQLPQFVNNRVKEIKEKTNDFIWQYCPTDSNPADLLSRGMSFTKFQSLNLWIHGPSWITNQTDWPTWTLPEEQVLTMCMDETKDERCFNLQLTTQETELFNLDRFSSYKRLLRVCAYVLRFVRNCRTNEKRTENITAEEIQEAAVLLIKESQIRKFNDVWNTLRSGTTKHNLVRQLRLYLDDNNLIRCGGGRIDNAPISENTKFPILLPSKDKLTYLIISEAHSNDLHSGVESTVTALRQSYWIPTIRQGVRTILRRCVVCRKVQGKPYELPDPPPLPANRLRDEQPFTVTGVDFSGAMNIRSKSNQESKAYVCLFTCANTRAVHLELVPDLSQDSFLLAFRRFTSRQSTPRVMISDNATTFVAGSKVLETLSLSGTTWKFIPKRAPWFGGWWERLIGLTKNCLRKVLGKAFETFETLRTIINEVESTLNDRPLTHVSSDPLDEEPLTPSHLLYGRKIRTLPFDGRKSDFRERSMSTNETVTKHAKLVSDIIQHFRNRWKTEYLTALREHYKFSGKNNSQRIVVGDIVQVHDEGSRMNWTLAIVDKLVHGQDGLVRSVVLRTRYGVTSRPINKLYPIEVNASDEDDDYATPRRAKCKAKELIQQWTKLC